MRTYIIMNVHVGRFDLISITSWLIITCIMTHASHCTCIQINHYCMLILNACNCNYNYTMQLCIKAYSLKASIIMDVFWLEKLLMFEVTHTCTCMYLPVRVYVYLYVYLQYISPWGFKK